MAGTKGKKEQEKAELPKQTSQESSSWIRWILAGLVVVMGIYFAKVQPENLTTVLNESAESFPLLEQFTGQLEYNENGYVVGRPLPDVTFMPASLSSQYEVKNPEDLSPYIKYLPGPPMKTRRERAMGARFQNFYPFDLTMWWDDGSEEGVYNGVLQANGVTSTNTYTTHSFIFRKRDSSENIIKLTMKEDQHFYFVGPDPDDKMAFETTAYKNALKEVAFMKDYYAKNGVPWLSHYPRDPPKLFLYPADFVGQKHRVVSNIGYFTDAKTQSKDPIEYNITVVSTEPRILLIEKLLSDFEIDHIISMGVKVVKASKVGSNGGGFASKTRTSENGWLKRSDSNILNTVYYRFGDVLGMTDMELRDEGVGSAENLQFVRYLETQRYDAHHDFGYTGRTEQRFSTMLIYLEVPEEGGGTSFPKAFDGQGIAVKPSRGDAVLFYSMLPDGNGDDLSLHSGMPVEKGRKYVCNLWSWDPKYR